MLSCATFLEGLMEHIIANLLSDFEHGKMTRRQLIQSLALAASAASGVGATTLGAAAPEGKGFKAIAVNHISYQVADYARTRDFYAALLGMKVSHDDGKQQAYLSFGDNGTWLLPRNVREPGTAPRVDHIAYTIDDWDKDKVKEELERRGLKARPDTDDSFHVQDPDGFDLQISGKGMKP
jgi:catechol 2,3-dioxygenase-like lactoylglutathione lyase family enzyme